MEAYNELDKRVRQLAQELPGITFGYIGNCGVDRSGPFDDRSWRIFLPHPGRVGTPSDSVYLGSTAQLAASLERWPSLEAQTRKNYPHDQRDLLAKKYLHR